MGDTLMVEDSEELIKQLVEKLKEIQERTRVVC